MPVEPRTDSARGGVIRTQLRRLLHARAVLAIWLASLWLVCASDALGADLQVVQVKEARPGAVVATVRTADSQPPATAFHLRFGGASPTADIVAKQVTPVTDLPADQATAVIVCLDRSGSMRLVVPAIKQALTEVFGTSRPDLQVVVLPFGSTIPPPTPFLSNQAAVVKAISGVQPELGKDGKTLLYDTVNRALNRLRDQAQGHGRLLVISDGKDEGSQLALESLLTEIRARGIPVDTIGYGREAKAFSGSLQNMSTASGGKYVLAGGEDQLGDAVRRDLGVKPVPTFDLHFNYTANTSIAPDNSAQLLYAVAGATPVSVPLHIALAPPVPPRPHTATPAPPAPKPVLPPPEPKENLFERFIKLLSGSSPIPKVNIGGFAAAILALVAALIWLATHLTRRPATPEAPITQAPSIDPRPMRAATEIGAAFVPPARSRPSARLIGRSGAWRGKEFPIEQTMIHVGADERNELSLAGDDYVSGKHATIRFEAGSLYLNDLSSTNGTFLNGARLSGTPRVLAPGDEIRFGRTVFELHGIGEHAFRHDEDRHRVP